MLVLVLGVEGFLICVILGGNGSWLLNFHFSNYNDRNSRTIRTPLFVVNT